MSAYPIVESQRDTKTIDEFIQLLPAHLKKAKLAYQNIHDQVGFSTRMVARRRYPNFFVPFAPSGAWPTGRVFDILGVHHYRKVLLVAMRFRWRPEDILALWQTEGLPGWIDYEGEKDGKAEPVTRWLMDAQGKTLKEPADEVQARAWTISTVLYTRWGLDLLIPHLRIGDNPPIGLSADEHKRFFEDSFTRECSPYLKTSPYAYLIEPGGPIKVTKQHASWRFHTNHEYQATLLALQMARFHKQRVRIPPSYEGFQTPVYTRPIFSAALYMHYNSPNAENNFKDLTQLMVGAARGASYPRTEFHGGDLYRFFTTQPIPAKLPTAKPSDIEKFVISYADDHGGLLNGHSWVNALRFEFVRRVYAELFADFEIDDPLSPYLVE